MSEVQEHINKDTDEKIKVLFKHADVANREMGLVHQELVTLKSDVAWLKKFFWAFVGPGITIIVGAVLYLIIRKP